jgi:carboxyl-terminal processing protease
MRALQRPVLLICLIVLLGSFAWAGDDLGPTRSNMKLIVKNVSNEIAKNFYDPNLKGLDWKALTEEAKQKIDKAANVQQMQAAIFELVERLDDSHTIYIRPMMTEEPIYGFDIKPFGDEIRVYDIARNGAAQKAGLKLGDRVHQLQGYEIDRTNMIRLLIYTRTLYAVSPIELLVTRPGEKGPITISIKPQIERHGIVLDRYTRYSELWSFVTERGKWDPDFEKKYLTYTAESQNKVGYVEVKEFGYEKEDFLKALVGKVRDSEALILDLRDCPGGYLKTLLSFAGLFEPTDTVMANEVGRKKTEPMKIPGSRNPVTVPIVVMVDSSTASASEMLARHLQLTKGAIVIGDKTAGMVTTALSFEEEIGVGYATDYGIGIAVSRVVFPGGEELEHKGVIPDVKCIPTQQDMQTGHDTCREMAYKVAKEAARKKAAPAPVASLK